ncbi:MAG: phospholipase D-like domain-containing protein, partial [Alistipes sp.]|nr:phospholipase D-like domain-containing protein [Alistipes sp.]
ILRMEKSKRKKARELTGGYTPSELLTKINLKVWQLQEMFMDTYARVLRELEDENIRILSEKELDGKQEEFCREYFANVVSQRIVPLMIRKSMKIPFLPDGKIYLAVRMDTGKINQPFRYSIIQLPVSEACPRFVVLPSSDTSRTDVIFLDDIVRLCLGDIFFMFPYHHISAYTFKIIRDAELSIDDDVSKSFIEKMETGITKRNHGHPIRLIYDKFMPADLLNLIAGKLGLRLKESLNPGGRYHMMSDLMQFPVIRPHLESRKPLPMRHPDIIPYTSILKIMRRKDILLNFPYHTFQHVIDFLREVAIDPRVESIYITLYRTADHSKVINALINAAKNGKKVTVLVELKARFDEEKNIMDSALLQSENIRVIHSSEDLKVHCKLILVERREGSGRQGYIYAGTGNFNETTARLYSDFGLLTCNEEIVSDASKLFSIIDNPFNQHSFDTMLVSPYDMRESIAKMVDREIHNARRGPRPLCTGSSTALPTRR